MTQPSIFPATVAASRTSSSSALMATGSNNNVLEDDELVLTKNRKRGIQASQQDRNKGKILDKGEKVTSAQPLQASSIDKKDISASNYKPYILS